MAQGEIIYGLHAVESVLRNDPRRVRRACLLQGRDDQRLARLADELRAQGIATERAERQQMDEWVGGARHQGVIAWCDSLPLYSESQLTDFLERLDSPPFLLVLDGVQDPHNLGACLRSADGAGVHGVIFPKDKASSITPVVRKVACGAVETLPLFQVTNLARALRMLQDAGVWLIGTAGEAEQSLYEADLTGPLALVMGGEGKGMRRLTREHCDSLVHLPMAGSVESLNVSVATGICLFEAVRQRRTAGKP